MTPRPWLVLAVGNPARGDDALGPLLLQALQAAGVADGGDVEVLEDFQLMPEHALDLRGRRGVLFVDAAHLGRGVTLEPLVGSPSVLPATHALGAAGLLRVAQQIDGVAPPAWQLGIEGFAFGLGEGLSPGARTNLAKATTMAQDWLRQRRRSLLSTTAVDAQRPDAWCTIVTGTGADCSTACDTEPSSTPRTGPSPRAPSTTRSHA